MGRPVPRPPGRGPSSLMSKPMHTTADTTAVEVPQSLGAAGDAGRSAHVSGQENTNMSNDTLVNDCAPRTKRFYHGTRAELSPGDLIEPGSSRGVGEGGGMTAYVYLSPNLDEAAWGG